MNFGGTNTKYNVPQDRPMPDLGPGNTRKDNSSISNGGKMVSKKTHKDTSTTFLSR
jgi:hypothetical protein